MESLLGFHPPHFSEEAAWLPGWLQPLDASNQAFQCSSGQGLEEIRCLEQNISTRENEKFSDDGGCKSFHLFLSGEDNSTMNFPSCSSNHEVQYHLHLSSNQESQNLSNPISSKSEPERRSEFNQSLIVPDSKVTPEDTREVIKGKNRKNPKVNAKSCKVDITDAIELAIAASEALIIHEVIKDEPSTQLSNASSSVLEAVIRVKEARLEELKETLGFEESNEVDFLLDLDELTMADAYEDVGLTVANHGYESVSHVKDSYASENHMLNAEQSCNEHVSLEVDCGSISLKQQQKQADYAAVGTENADLACNIDPMLSCSVEQVDFCMKEAGLQREDNAIRDLTASQTILRSSPITGNNEREDKMRNLVPDRFESRWFGGWTCKKEVGIPTITGNNHKKSIPEPFANETSSLSESAPDRLSGIQKHHNIISQSSVAPIEDAYHHNNNNNNLPDDMPISPMDPLCSVVPCSFSSDTLPHHNDNHPEVNLDNDPKTISPQISDSCHHNETPVPEVNGMSPLKNCSMLIPPEVNFDNPKPISPQIPDSCHDNRNIRRQVSSLKTYSMLCPNSNPYLDKEHRQTPIRDANSPAKQDTELKKTNLPIATNVKSSLKSCLVPGRKRVRFSETEITYAPPVKKTRHKVSYFTRPRKREKLLLRDLKFLLTGFSVKKHKQIKNLVQKNGGIVLDDIPSPSTTRVKKKRRRGNCIILCPRKLLTTKFLYGCAVNACILNEKWLFDSLNEGSILAVKKYMILKEDASRNDLIFENVAIMIHGKQDFCSKMAKVVKHGGGLVFKTFHWMVKRVESRRVSVVGAIVVEEENGVSRQLKQCAVEQKIPVVPVEWIINSLYAGKLLPSPLVNHPSMEVSQEI